MKNRFCIFAVAGGFAFAAAAVFASGQQPPTIGHTGDLVIKTLSPRITSELKVTSPSFKTGDDIPYEYTQYRGNIFPGLTWTSGPAGTRSYAVIVQGESLSRAGAATSIHLTLFSIPGNVTTLKKGMDSPPPGSTYGPNVHGQNQPYAGPHTHTAAKNGYHYEVFALDSMLDLKPNVEFDALVAAMKGHVLASGELVGVSARDPEAPPDPPAVHAADPAPIHIESGLLVGVSPGFFNHRVQGSSVCCTARRQFASMLPSHRSVGRVCAKLTISAIPVRSQARETT